MMSTKHSFKLIDGVFTPLEADKILSGLIKYKINHHQMELFSNQERFGKDVSNSIKRVEELKAVTSSLKNTLGFIAERGQKMQINCSIEIITLDAG
ncbi:hypothetical protein [Parasediminibacterium sp. JCM 36343]|uniref:hypothetical protein n=1 Tax=Parasediminibacterium sp. JCM 36343 TaxID=3374279 RepID=UPI00397B2507